MDRPRPTAHISPSHSQTQLSPHPINNSATNSNMHNDDNHSSNITDSIEPLQDQIMFLCINLSRYTPNTRFILLSIGTIFFFLVNSYVEEYMYSALPGWRFGLFMTLIELICFSMIAIIERKLLPTADDIDGVLSHKAALKQHFYVGALMTWSRGLTNVSLEYLSYPTQVIFKSAKLLTVMIGSVWITNKSYSKLEYSSAVLLAMSAAFFSLGDDALNSSYSSSDINNDAHASVNYIGIIIVSISLVFDSLHSNTQDKLVRQYHASTAEAMLYTNFYAAILVLLATVSSGQFIVAFQYCQQNPISWLLLTIRSFVIYFGVLCFITLVKSSGAVAATAVTTIRKIATIACSFILFPKPITTLHLIGCLTFMLSVGLSFVVVRQQQSFKHIKYGLVSQNDSDSKKDTSELQMVTIDKTSNQPATMKSLRDKAQKK